MKATFDKSGIECNITPDRLIDSRDIAKLNKMSNSTNETTPD